MKEARIFSGIQSSGILHIGNYIGSMKNWLTFQEQYPCIFSIVDLHAITVPQDPQELHENILRTAALYLACGIDAEKHIMFVQSDVGGAHAELAWILNTVTKVSELKLMHQFKEKSKQDPEQITMGLFDYPVLMAADILLYQTTLVPVGEDQQQHIELTRELARRFNSRFGKTFVEPESFVPKVGGRIMGLDDPSKKMAKSASSALNYIALTDSPDEIRKKIQRAVTDSGSEIVYTPSKPALSNLITIYHLISDIPIKDIEKRYEGKGYREFKEDLTDVLIDFLTPVQKNYQQYLGDKHTLQGILKKGAQKAQAIAAPTVQTVKERVGLGL